MRLPELNLILNKINKNTEDFDVFIETGSFVGETMTDMKNVFKKIISIEITEKYYNYCKNLFKNDKNIELIHGDSLKILPLLIEKWGEKKILFFLDAHCSAGDTGKNHLDVPLIEELNLINKNLDNSCLIIIDDSDLFDGDFGVLTWKGINEKNILNVLTDRVLNFFYVQNTVVATNKSRLIIELKEK